MKIPRSPSAALRRLVFSQLRLQLRGLRYVPRAKSDVSTEKLEILETQRAAISGLSSHAPLIAASVADDLLLRALDSGVSEYVAHALAQQANFISFATPGAADRITRLHEAALRIASEVDDAALLGRVEMLIGNAYVNRGLWREGRVHEARALELLRGKAHGVQWVIDGAQLYDQVAAFARGDFRDVARVTPSVVEHGFSRDRIWVGAVMSGQFGSAAWLCSDDVAGYQRILESAKARWRPQADAQWPDYFLAFGQVALNLYRHEPVTASATAERLWPWLARSLVVRAQAAHSFGLLLRGTAAVAALRASGDSSSGSAVRDCIKRLPRLDLPEAASYRNVLDAGLALHARDAGLGAQHLRAAIAGFDRGDMSMYAAAARRRLGELLGGDEGQALLAQADATMRGQGVVDLDAMTEMLCAGCRQIA